MKKFKTNNKFIAAVLLMLTFSLSTFSANASLILSFDIQDTEVSLGESFTVNLFASTDANIPGDAFSGWGLDLNFNNSILALDSLLVSPVFMAINNDSDGLGGFDPFNSFSGANILLATINFTALAIGNSDLLTSATAGDFNEGFFSSTFQPVSYDNAATSINITGSNEVPEPSAFLLMLLATIALVALRRKV